MPQRELRLKNSIENVKPFYDYIFIDCPPSLGLLTINALAMTNTVLIPIQCEFYALEGGEPTDEYHQSGQTGFEPATGN